MQLITISYIISQLCKEDSGMAEDIYGPSVPHLKGKIVCHKIQHLEPIMIPNPPKGIFDRYNEFTLCSDLIHINGIESLNTICQHILFSKVSMIINRKINKIEDIIKQVNKL